MREFIIGSNEAGQRFDKYLFKLLKNASRGLIYKQLRNKNIILNNKKAKGSEILDIKDVVRVFMSDSTIDNFMAKRINNIPDTDIKVIYEDNDIIIADKPVGILSQKSKPDDISMNELLMGHLLKNGFDIEELNTFNPSFCNRLDRNTSGLMIGGKTLKGLQKMSEIIKNRSISKYYLAIVKGRLEEPSLLEGSLIKDSTANKVIITDRTDNDKNRIYTEYMPLAAKEDMTLLKVKLITGKTHQIRAHLAYTGHPIMGDEKYGDRKFNKDMGVYIQMLHAYEIVFPDMQDFPCISRKSINTGYPDRFLPYFKGEETWLNHRGSEARYWKK